MTLSIILLFSSKCSARYFAAKKEEAKKMEELIWKIYFSEENLERPSFFIEDCGD